MKAYRGHCDTCGFTATRSTHVEARQALDTHPCPRRCGMCGFLFYLLVDDALCISCDSRMFPFPASIPSPPSRRIA